MACESDVYRKLYHTKFRGNYSKTFQIFGVPIGNAKITIKVQFHPVAPVIKYHQKTSNSCFLGSLASSFHYINEIRDVPALVNCSGESLTLEKENCKNRIHFSKCSYGKQRKNQR